MIREAKRPLAAPVRTGPDTFDIAEGRYTNDVYASGYARAHAGKPAVTVRMHSYLNGAVSFVDPNVLRDLANELLEAAAWLGNAIVEQKEGGQ